MNAIPEDAVWGALDGYAAAPSKVGLSELESFFEQWRQTLVIGRRIDILGSLASVFADGDSPRLYELVCADIKRIIAAANTFVHVNKYVQRSNE